MEDAIEWIGNPLSKEGTWCRVGNRRAELSRASVDLFAEWHPTPAARRAWILNISEVNELRIGDDVALSVMLFNMLPEQAKREAEIILRWADAHDQLAVSEQP